MSTPSNPLTRALGDFGSAAWLLAGAARDAVVRPDGERLAQALAVYLWRPLPVVVVLGALVGLIFGLPMSDLVKMVRAEQVVGSTVSVIVVREIVPLLIGVMAAGLVSVDLASRLASDEPGHRALAPALAAVLLAAPIHTVAATMANWLTVGLIMQDGPLIPWPVYYDLTIGPQTYRATWTGVVKTALFTLVALGAGAAAGSRDYDSEVERMRAAFIAGLVGVLSAVALWTWLD